MITLVLGVVDIPYVANETLPKQRGRVRKHTNAPRVHHADTVTTGDVATWLENRYHVMEVFFQENAQTIADDLASGMAGYMEDQLMGAPARNPGDLFAGVASSIDASFRDFLSLKKMDTLGIPGIPTHAAETGVNHRLKKRRGAPRPSFIDTGLYQNSFKAEFV